MRANAPVPGVSAPQGEVPRFLSREACWAVVTQLREYARIENIAPVLVDTRWRGDVRWARNRVYVARDWRNNTISQDYTNQLDPASIAALTAFVTRKAQAFPLQFGAVAGPPEVLWAPPRQHYPGTHIWSDQTYEQPPDEREEIAVRLAASAERAGVLSAGSLIVEAWGTTMYTRSGLLLYAPRTLAQCSLTVRDPQGKGSGWAGASSYDWSRIDATKLADIALDKCLRSRNPQRLEPGRYMAILEPQATFALITPVVTSLTRAGAESLSPEPHPYKTHRKVSYQLRDGSTVDFDPTRVGERLLDERIDITFDPLDPDLGVLPFMPNDGDAIVPVTWFQQGVLKTLAYDREYALQRLHQSTAQPNPGAFRMSGGTTTIEEMIATTPRGLLITRFVDVTLLDRESLLSTGLTRDGLWLIENGQLTRPVQNFRFTDSPFAAFNQVEQLGVPVPIFNPETPALVPPVKVRELNFTTLIDAV